MRESVQSSSCESTVEYRNKSSLRCNVQSPSSTSRRRHSESTSRVSLGQVLQAGYSVQRKGSGSKDIARVSAEDESLGSAQGKRHRLSEYRASFSLGRVYHGHALGQTCRKLAQEQRRKLFSARKFYLVGRALCFLTPRHVRYQVLHRKKTQGAANQVKFAVAPCRARQRSRRCVHVPDAPRFVFPRRPEFRVEALARQRLRKCVQLQWQWPGSDVSCDVGTLT